MPYARWQATIVDGAGNIIPSPWIEVRREIAGAPLATIYSGRNGGALGNPFQVATADGFAAFHVAGGAYQIRAYAPGFERVLRYVGIGLASESDSGDGGGGADFGVREVTGAGDVAVAVDDEIILLNKAVGAATNVNFPAAADYAGRGISIKDIKGDAGANNATPVFNGAETCDGLAGSQFKVAVNYGEQGVFRPLPSGAGWYLHRR